MNASVTDVSVNQTTGGGTVRSVSSVDLYSVTHITIVSCVTLSSELYFTIAVDNFSPHSAQIAHSTAVLTPLPGQSSESG